MVLSGAFPDGSCRIMLANAIFASPAARGTPCPAPDARKRVFVDAENGRLIEVVAGG